MAKEISLTKQWIRTKKKWRQIRAFKKRLQDHRQVLTESIKRARQIAQEI